MNVVCHSVTADRLLVIHRGGGDTLTLHNQGCLNFLHSEERGPKPHFNCIYAPYTLIGSRRYKYLDVVLIP